LYDLAREHLFIIIIIIIIIKLANGLSKVSKQTSEQNCYMLDVTRNEPCKSLNQ